MVKWYIKRRSGICPCPGYRILLFVDFFFFFKGWIQWLWKSSQGGSKNPPKLNWMWKNYCVKYRLHLFETGKIAKLFLRYIIVIIQIQESYLVFENRAIQGKAIDMRGWVVRVPVGNMWHINLYLDSSDRAARNSMQTRKDLNVPTALWEISRSTWPPRMTTDRGALSRLLIDDDMKRQRRFLSCGCVNDIFDMVVDPQLIFPCTFICILVKTGDSIKGCPGRDTSADTP